MFFILSKGSKKTSSEIRNSYQAPFAMNLKQESKFPESVLFFLRSYKEGNINQFSE